MTSDTSPVIAIFMLLLIAFPVLLETSVCFFACYREIGSDMIRWQLVGAGGWHTLKPPGWPTLYAFCKGWATLRLCCSGWMSPIPLYDTHVLRSLRPFPFLDFHPLTLDFQFLIPDRYSFSAKSFQYYRILLFSCY